MAVTDRSTPRQRIVTAAIVAYDTPMSSLQGLLQDIRQDGSASRILLVDNSTGAIYNDICSQFGVHWVRPARNIGYGPAHNLAFETCCIGSDYHIVLNPDIRIPMGTIARLSDFMEMHDEAGVVMPRIAYPDGSTQHVCKLLPSPADLIVRRFLPLERMKKNGQDRLELKAVFGYDRVAEVPWLSGSFMFIRTSVAKKVGLFDPRFFLYMEDTDLSRRLGSVSRNMYFPGATVYHAYRKESYKSMGAALVHIRSAIKYFNKWGWIFDSERRRINRRTLRELRRPLPLVEKEGDR